MTVDEAMRHMRERTPLDQLRAVFSSAVGELEQAEMQRTRPTAIERRCMEFRIVERLLARAIELGLVEEKT